MKKITYTRPLAEVIELDAADIIRTSYGTTGLSDSGAGTGYRYAEGEYDATTGKLKIGGIN